MTALQTQPLRAIALLAGVVALLLLAACEGAPVRAGLTDVEKASLTVEQQLFVAEADYIVNKADFVAYAEQPKCSPPDRIVGCHDPQVVKELRTLDKQLREAFRVARVATGADQAVKADVARALLARFAAGVAALAITGG